MRTALATRFPGVNIANLTIIKKIEGTATKLRYRLDYAKPTDATGAPPSLCISIRMASRDIWTGST
jgi:hypothetical protein